MGRKSHRRSCHVCPDRRAFYASQSKQTLERQEGKQLCQRTEFILKMAFPLLLSYSWINTADILPLKLCLFGNYSNKSEQINLG